MYQLNLQKFFLKKVSKVKERAPATANSIKFALEKLAQDPKQAGLKSHKVKAPKFGECWSNRVTGDLRIIWNYSQTQLTILDILDLGGHSGKDGVY
jgi:addiction module RelE/StbE family toxin